jgi:hypothetical protein
LTLALCCCAGLFFNDSFRMPMREPVHGMQGPGKAQDESFCFSPAPGSSDAKDALRHATSRILKARAKSSAAEGEALQGYI